MVDAERPVNLRWISSSVANLAMGSALVLGVLAALAGTPDRARNARIDVDNLASAVEHEDDHVTAIELAEWIRDRRSGLRVIDIRSSEEFNASHIPTAERIQLSDLSKTPFRRDETIVLYSEGGAHAGQGWVFLRALGYDKVYWLRGGMQEWSEDVMNPTLELTASDSAKKAFGRVSDLSRYFGGSPKREAVGERREAPAQRLAPSRFPLPSSRLPLPSSRNSPPPSHTWGRGC